MEIVLKSLDLQNFKGIKKKKIDFYQKTEISGANEAGKTTIYDAFLWLLFDKDSRGNTGGIKPHDEDGNEIHRVDTVVTGTFDIDGEELKLSKVFAEKWTKKRGNATEEFTGHTTDYFWNDVPIKKSDYQSNLYNIIDEDLFKLLSNTRYFLFQLSEKDRRDMLMKFADESNTEDILKDHPELEELEEALEKHSIDELLAMHKASATKINKEIQEVQPRIDENYSMIKELDFEALKTEKTRLEKAIETLEKSAVTTSSGVLEQIERIKGHLAGAEKSIIEEKRKAQAKFNDQIDKKEAEAREAKRSYEDIKDKKSEAIRRHRNLETEIEEANADIIKSREEWKNLQNAVWRGETVCQVCGQDLPADKLQAAIEAFEADKKTKLALIVDWGKKCQAKIIEKTEEAKKAKQEIENLISEEEQAERKYLELAAAVGMLREAKIPESVMLKTLEASRESYIKKLQELEGEDNPTEKAEIEKEVHGLRLSLDYIMTELAQESTNEQAEKRIKELESKAKQLGKDYEAAQRMIALCEAYTRYKMDVIKTQIDSEFKFVKWRLFEEQINGGIKSVCQPLYKGSDLAQMNDGAKVLVGLDIINTFAKAKDVYLPIFIDNAETVTDYKGIDDEIESQQIRLTAVKRKTLEIKEG